MKKRLLIYFLLTCILFACFSVYAQEEITEKTAEYVMSANPEPKPGLVGGEWAAIGVFGSGINAADYLAAYRRNAEENIKEKQGRLDDIKYTEYSKTVLALLACGACPENIAGYNILTPLCDFDETVFQGINGAIWALIALDSGDFSADFKDIKEKYINYILEKSLPSGGWSMMNEPEADITAMALTALCPHKDYAGVSAAVNKALDVLSEMQNDDGSFKSGGVSNAESCAQVLTALSEMRISIDDERFVKNGKTVKDALLSFRLKDGSFEHIKGGGTDLIATEQGLYALDAYRLAVMDGRRLFDFSEVGRTEITYEPKRHKDVKKSSVKYAGKSFEDIYDKPCEQSVKELASRGIINGMTDNLYMPDSGLTRAQFAAITVKALGLPLKEYDGFKDVTKEDWFYGYVASAKDYGIVLGVTDDSFNPDSHISREQAAVMTARASALCGKKNDVTGADDILSDYYDYKAISAWAEKDLAFCLKSGIIQTDESCILPQADITRGEIAVMIYNMLLGAELI